MVHGLFPDDSGPRILISVTPSSHRAQGALSLASGCGNKKKDPAGAFVLGLEMASRISAHISLARIQSHGCTSTARKDGKCSLTMCQEEGMGPGELIGVSATS